MDAAIAAQVIIETHAVADTGAVDEDHDMRPQLALLIECITAQPGVTFECRFERIAQLAR